MNKTSKEEVGKSTCTITLSGWLKFGKLVQAFPFLPGVGGHNPSNFLPHVRTCLKLKSGMVTQPRVSILRRCFPFSPTSPGGSSELANKVMVS